MNDTLKFVLFLLVGGAFVIGVMYIITPEETRKRNIELNRQKEEREKALKQCEQDIDNSNDVIAQTEKKIALESYSFGYKNSEDNCEIAGKAAFQLSGGSLKIATIALFACETGRLDKKAKTDSRLQLLSNIKQKYLGEGCIAITEKAITNERQETKNIQTPQDEASISSAQADNKEKLQALIESGNSLKNAGKYHEAIEAYQKALQINPTSDEMLVDLGTCYGKMKQHDKAIDSYKKAITINPNNYRGHWNMGLALLLIKEDDKDGLKELEEAVRIVSNMPDTNKSKEILSDMNEKLKRLKTKMEQQSSSSTPAFNEELLGIKYVMAVEDGSLFCYVDDSWTAVSNNIKKDFLKQIGNKKYFGKKQFTVRNSRGERVAEYRSGNVKLF